LISQKDEGRMVFLCTGSDFTIAERVALHVGIFDGVIASNGEENVTGKTKAYRLTERFPRGFVYAGNSADDLKVWKASSKAIVVTSSDAFLQRVRSAHEVENSFTRPTYRKKDLLKAVRLHQWTKNLLLFVPFLLDTEVASIGSFVNVCIAFLAFSLLASATYLINDLLDLSADRVHRSKRNRAIAAGRLPIRHASAYAAAMFCISGIIMLYLPIGFLIVAGLYLFCTLLYSFWIKRIMVLDVCCLAGLFTMRVIAGTVVVGSQWSFWLLAFSMFIFLSLAICKRTAELHGMLLENKTKTSGRAYSVNDIGILNSLGVTSGYLSVLVVALYINSEKVKTIYSLPEALWWICPVLLYWIGRVWLMSSRGEMLEDPIVFAITDRTSHIAAILCGIIIYVASELSL
jgi:4-hydroxybenzoate polyprenyltransferase